MKNEPKILKKYEIDRCIKRISDDLHPIRKTPLTYVYPWLLGCSCLHENERMLSKTVVAQDDLYFSQYLQLAEDNNDPFLRLGYGLIAYRKLLKAL
jgi:hypothetical protein